MKGKIDVRDHGWFVFFAPHDKPEIAGVIFGERAEHGYDAAPIAKYAMETYFAKKEGRPLPTLPPKAAPGAAPIVAAGEPAAPAAAATAGTVRSGNTCSNAASSSTSTGCCSRPC